jgi:hypothetical protein
MTFQAIFNESRPDRFFEEIRPGLHPRRMVGRNRICLRGDDEKNEGEAVQQFRHTSVILS